MGCISYITKKRENFNMIKAADFTDFSFLILTFDQHSPTARVRYDLKVLASYDLWDKGNSFHHSITCKHSDNDFYI